MRSSVVGTRDGPPRNAFRFFCPVRLKNRNWLVFGLVNPGIYGDAAIVTPYLFVYDDGFVCGCKSGDHCAEFSAPLLPW